MDKEVNDSLQEITSELAYIGEKLTEISKCLQKMSNWNEADEEMYGDSEEEDFDEDEEDSEDEEEDSDENDDEGEEEEEDEDEEEDEG